MNICQVQINTKIHLYRNRLQLTSNCKNTLKTKIINVYYSLLPLRFFTQTVAFLVCLKATKATAVKEKHLQSNYDGTSSNTSYIQQMYKAIKMLSI